MKQFLSKPRSIVGATLWGSIIAIAVFLSLIVADWMLAVYQKNFGPAQQISAIAVGKGYSISLTAKPSHPFLAEYEQHLEIYGGTARNGRLLGRIELPANTGGRVQMAVLVSAPAEKPEIVLADRYAITKVDLANQQTTALSSWRLPQFTPLGILSGESLPLKFIPCSIWPAMPAEEQRAIIDSNDPIHGFCEQH